MENLTAGQSPRISHYPASDFGSVGKTLAGSLPQNKSLGASTELSAWIEQAYAYYQAVVDGSEPKPSPDQWNEFLNQLNWATGQTQPAWDPDGESVPILDPDDGAGESDPFGGVTGPLHNLVYNSEKVRIGFTGNSEISDIWSDDVTIDVASLSASVTSEITQDTRFNPAEEVLKIIVQDPATGLESVFMVHDAKDAAIKINTPKEAQLKSKAPAVTWGNFQENEADASSATNPEPDATEPGEAGLPGTAIYNKNPEVELTAFGDKQYETYRIYAPGTFTLHVSNYSDTVEVKPVGKAPFPAYIISVINEAGKAEDYMVFGPPENIVIDGLNVKLVDGAATDPTIQVAGRPDAEPAAAPLAKLKEVLNGKSDAQILNALKASFPEIDSIEKLTAQMASGAFPPARPTRALLQFLWTIDETFSGELNKARTWDHTIIGPAYKAATERLVVLLKALYPDHNVSVFQPGTTNGFLDWPALNDFTFDGIRMSYTNESEGHTTELLDL